MFFKVWILVCSIAIPGFQCDSHTARISMAGPDSPTPFACQLQGQAFLADTESGKDIDPSKEYVKITCTPKKGKIL